MALKRLVVLCLALVVLVVLTGCGSSEDPATEIEATDAVEFPSTTSTTVDPYAVPSVIDETYINKILAAHEEIRAAVRRDVINNHEFSELNQKRIRALYTGDALEFQFGLWTDEALKDHSKFKPNPGPAMESVKTIHHADRECIWVTETVDETRNLVTPHPTPTDADIVLVRQTAGRDSPNRTPWAQKQATAPNLLTEEQACG